MNETSLVLAVQSLVFATPWMLTVVIICAKDLIFANILLAIWMLASRKPQERHAVFEAGWAVALALIITSVLSHFIGRVRPFLSDPHVLLLIPAPLNTSFPSGHTATAVAIACAIWFGNKDLGIISFAIAAFVAVGRIAAGVHYPTDVLGGLFVGVLSFGIVRLAHHELARRDIIKAAALHHHDA